MKRLIIYNLPEFASSADLKELTEEFVYELLGVDEATIEEELDTMSVFCKEQQPRPKYYLEDIVFYSIKIDHKKAYKQGKIISSKYTGTRWEYAIKDNEGTTKPIFEEDIVEKKINRY